MPDSAGAGSPRALIVDDDDPIRLMLSRIVERHSFVVETARDGQEAIERLRDNCYRLIVLDLMMPRVDGYAVLQYMKEHKPESLSRTIIASAIPESEILKRVSATNVKIRTKPFDMKQLIADIESLSAG
jgi:DNA-binding response OmpR family regulator